MFETIAGSAMARISRLSFFVLFSFFRTDVEECNQGSISNEAENLRDELATVRGHGHAAENCDGGKHAEEGTAGDETRGNEGAAVGAGFADSRVFGAAPHEP